jgi:CheY-like chemotaxis protein
VAILPRGIFDLLLKLQLLGCTSNGITGQESAMVQDQEEAHAAGCDELDTKPVELPRLLEKIKALLPGLG